MNRGPLSRVFVHISVSDRRRGTLAAGNMRFACALGRAGTGLKKREGDGLTPIGSFGLRRLHVRTDRLFPPRTRLSWRRIAPTDWWSDIAGDRAYNRLVTRRPPPPGSDEHLARRDDLYDLVVEIGYNDRPVIRNRGSGIFLHGARPGFSPTAGCVAISLNALARILPLIGPGTRIVIGQQGPKAR